MAVCMAAINSLVSTPNAVNPRIRSSSPMSAFMNPRVSESVRAENDLALQRASPARPATTMQQVQNEIREQRLLRNPSRNRRYIGPPPERVGGRALTHRDLPFRAR